MELFADTGYKVVEATSRVFDEPMREKFLPLIREIAKIAGFDPEVAANDTLPLQYVVRATPA